MKERLRSWLRRQSALGRDNRWLWVHRLGGGASHKMPGGRRLRSMRPEDYLKLSAPCTEGGYTHHFEVGDRCEWCGTHVDLLV